MINEELKIDDKGEKERISGVIPLNGQDEGTVFRQKQSNSRGKADVWVWMLGVGRCGGGFSYDDSVFLMKWEATSLAESEHLGGTVGKVREGRRY